MKENVKITDERARRALADARQTAADYARMAHEGQKDKGGHDYFTSHLEIVAGFATTPKQTIAAYFHDVAEDTPHSEAEAVAYLKKRHPDLADADCREIEQALCTLNHKRYSSREEYIKAIAANPLARAVKMCDLRSNMDISRIPNPTDADFQRLERYKKEYSFLEGIQTI